MSNIFKGTVKAITEKQTGTSQKGDWEKQQVIIEEKADKYPQSIVVDCFNKPDEINKIQVGIEVECYYSTQAREYQGKWYGNNDLWKFTTGGRVEVTQNLIPQTDDLPF